MERFRVIEGIRKKAEKGDIHVGPRSIQRATDAYRASVVVYEESKRTLIEAMFPRHYRVVVWGSARLDENTPEYAFTRDLSEALVTKTGCDIITGGGPGIMQAAIEGGLQARQKAEQEGRKLKSRNRGVRIELPFEEATNPLMDGHTLHSGFSTRLDEFLIVSNAVYVAPGGIGSALELLMPLQLKQVGHLEPDFPIIVHPFWLPMLSAMSITMHDDRVRAGQVPLVSEGDLSDIIVSDNIPEIVDIISANHTLWEKNIKSKVKKQDQTRLFD